MTRQDCPRGAFSAWVVVSDQLMDGADLRSSAIRQRRQVRLCHSAGRQTGEGADLQVGDGWLDRIAIPLALGMHVSKAVKVATRKDDGAARLGRNRRANHIEMQLVTRLYPGPAHRCVRHHDQCVDL
jgi:hypothetical protein